MDAVELYNKNGEPIGIYACGKCRRLTLGSDYKNTRESAEACCRPTFCKICNEEFKDHPYHSECSKCRRIQYEIEHATKQAQLLDAATEVSDYSGPVYYEHEDGDMGEGFFSSLEELLDRLHDGDDDSRPEFVFCCTSTINNMDINDILENICSDGYEDMADRLDVHQGLLDEINKFNSLNKEALTIWNVDFKHKVRVSTKVAQ